MQHGLILEIIVLIILLFLSSFFSASETALMSLSKIRIKHMVKENIKGADVVEKLVEKPNTLLGAILIGNNVVNIGASALATYIAVRHFGSKGVGIATSIMTVVVLIFGEITPKSLAVENSEKVSLRVARIISIITMVLSPILAVLMSVTGAIIKALGGKQKTKQPFITEEELKTMVHVSHEEGILEGDEKKMIYNVFDFGDSQVKEVMTPRTDMTAIGINTPYNEIINIFREMQYSRIPVYEDITDNIVGILYIKDLIFYNSEEVFDLHKYMREPYFTYEFKKISELFQEMQKNRIPIAIVLDEYGGTAGIITMEDLVEEIVGEIQDEYDTQEEEITVVKEDEYIVDGSTKIDLVNEMLGIFIETEEFDSIGGFVLGEIGRLPHEGETIEYNGIKFIAEKIDKNRIDKIRIIT